MLDEITLRIMHEFNGHWKTGEIPRRLLGSVETSLFEHAAKKLHDRSILSVVGLRRTGKSTLLYQLADMLLRNGTQPKRVFYFSFDETTSKKPEVIDDLIREYFSSVCKEPLDSKETHYIILDEVQKVEDWQGVVKRHYDLKYGIKFVVSGSQTLMLKGKTRESLAGRTRDFTSNPLSFREFLKFKGMKVPHLPAKELYRQFLPEKEKMRNLFEEFLLKGGFPETVGYNAQETQGYIKSVVEKIVFIDIPLQFKVENPEILMRMLELLSSNTAQLFELEKITGTLSINRNTAAAYLSHLENAFLIKLCYNCTKSKAKQLRTRRKAYIADTGIANTMLRKNSLSEDPEYAGLLAETAIFNEIARKHDAFFWRDKSQNEIDILAKINGKISPVEVKYRNEITAKDTSTIERYVKEHKTQGTIVTKDTYKHERRLTFMPAWLFCMSNQDP